MSTAVSSPRPASALMLPDSANETRYLKAPTLVIPVLAATPQPSTPQPKSPSNSTVPRKMLDMLSPLLRGTKRSTVTPPTTPTPAAAAVAAVAAPYPASPMVSRSSAASPQHSSTSPSWLARAPATPTYHAAPSTVDPGSPDFSQLSYDTSSPMSSDSGGRQVVTAKTALQAGGMHSPVKVHAPTSVPRAAPSPFAAAADAPMMSAAEAAAAAAVAAAVAQHKPMAVFPALGRLCAAARICALPPSRTVPEPGTPHYPTEMLALALGVPPRMARPSWCLADYAVIEKLYKGYASSVYKAFCKSSSEVVVLKVYTLAAVCDLYKYQIYREVRLHSGVQHENIVTMYAAWQEGDKVVMVQEYADGADLFQVMQRYGGRLTERLAVQLVLEPFMRVLHYLHSRGIMHRDIKPENILFTRNMVLKLADFGLAIDMREERAVTRAGTLDYMAPEVLRCPFKSCPDENKDNERLIYSAGVDTWAVGVMTYELCVGYPPFYNKTRSETERQILHCMPSFPTSMSEGAKDFITSTLLKDPSRRLDIGQMLHHAWVQGFKSRRSGRVSQSQVQQVQQMPQRTSSALTAPLSALPAPVASHRHAGGSVSVAAGSGSGSRAAAAAAVAAAAQDGLDGFSSAAAAVVGGPVTGKLLSSVKVRHPADGSVFVGARVVSGEWRQSPVKAYSPQRIEAHTSLSY